jgi:hypothetical protein
MSSASSSDGMPPTWLMASTTEPGPCARRHLLQVVVGPDVDRQAQAKQPRLQVARHEPRGGARAVDVDVRRGGQGGGGGFKHRHIQLIAHAQHRAGGAAHDLADHILGGVVQAHAAVQGRAAQGEFLRQRQLELAQPGKAQVTAGAHDGGHRAARALRQRLEAFLQRALGVLQHQLQDHAARGRGAGAGAGHALQQAVGHQNWVVMASTTR